MSQTPPEVTPPPEGGSVVKRVVIGALIVVGAVILLAEIGVLKFDSTSTNWSTDHHYKSSWQNRIYLGGLRLDPKVTNRETGSGKAIAEEAAKALRKVASGQAGDAGVKFNIAIDNLTVHGAPWLPLFRSASGTFTASYELEAVAGGSAIHVQGQITGKIDQSMKGLSSLGFFRETMGKAIADGIANDIKRMIAKNGR